MRQKTRKAATIDLQKEAKKGIVKITPILKREELISTRADAMRKGELTVESFGHELKLSPLQISFCVEYTKPNQLGDHITAYAYAAGLDISNPEDLKKAKSKGAELSDHVGCCTLIDALLQTEGLNMNAFNRQLWFMMMQMGDKRSKLQAMKLFADMQGVISKHSEVVHKHVFDYSSLSDEEMELAIRLKEKAKLKEIEDYRSPDFSKVMDAEIVKDEGY